MTRVQIARRYNSDNGRSADVFYAPESKEFSVHKRNGDLYMGDEEIDGNPALIVDDVAKRDAIDAADEFVNGRITNTEMVYRLMERAASGPLMQGFVVEALAKYADQILGATNEELGGDRAFINPDSWRACAREVEKTVEKHLEN